MQAAEILRKLADIVDGRAPQTDVAGQVPHQVNHAAMIPVEPESQEHVQVNTQSMVSPLQQKMELLKKAVGVDSAYDSGELDTDAEADEKTCGCEEPCACNSEDELDQMKQRAGLPVVMTLAASNDVEE